MLYMEETCDEEEVLMIFACDDVFSSKFRCSTSGRQRVSRLRYGVTHAQLRMRTMSKQENSVSRSFLFKYLNISIDDAKPFCVLDITIRSLHS